MLRSLRVIALVVVVAAAGGCSSGSGRPAPAASAVGDHAPFPSPSMAAIDDPPGTNTCRLLVAAVNGGTLMEPGVVEAIVAASGTADAPLADAATRLGGAYAAATKASAGSGEPDAVAAVSQAGSDMASVCDESDLATVG